MTSDLTDDARYGVALDSYGGGHHYYGKLWRVTADVIDEEVSYRISADEADSFNRIDDEWQSADVIAWPN